MLTFQGRSTDLMTHSGHKTDAVAMTHDKYFTNLLVTSHDTSGPQHEPCCIDPFPCFRATALV